MKSVQNDLREETDLTKMNEMHAEVLNIQLVRKLYFSAISVGCCANLCPFMVLSDTG